MSLQIIKEQQYIVGLLGSMTKPSRSGFNWIANMQHDLYNWDKKLDQSNNGTQLTVNQKTLDQIEEQQSTIVKLLAQ